MERVFERICKKHGYNMVNEFCGEINLNHGIYRISLVDNHLILSVFELDWVVLEDRLVLVKETPNDMSDVTQKLIHHILNCWEREYYLTPGFTEIRDNLLSEFEKMNHSSISIKGNKDLENLVLAIYKKGLNDGRPFC